MRGDKHHLSRLSAKKNHNSQVAQHLSQIPDRRHQTFCNNVFGATNVRVHAGK